MFLTLDSAWKLLAIAFYGLLTFNSVAWAQITPVPGGVSSIGNQSSLSSSAGSSMTKPSPFLGTKSLRPLIAVRPAPELPPVPPARSSNGPEAQATIGTPQIQSELTFSGRSAKNTTEVVSTQTPPKTASNQTASNQAAPTQTAPTQAAPTPTTAAPRTVAPTSNDKFMLDLESDLSGPAASSSADTHSGIVFAPTAQTKNTSINPAHAKSFVVQASTTGEVPPMPPAPSAPLLPAPPKPAIKAGTAAQTSDLPEPKKQVAEKVIDDEFESLNANAPKPAVPSATTTAEPIKAQSKLDSKPSEPKASSPTVMHIGDQPKTPKSSNTPTTSTTSTTSQTSATSSTSKASQGNNSGSASITPGGSTKAGKPQQVSELGKQILESIEFDDVNLADAMKLFSEQSGLNVITSTEAGKAKVTVFLKHVTAINALEAIVKANGLFYRIEEASGIVRIATSKEYEKDLSSFREEQTRVFTLLYPNPIAVAQVIQQVFGSRVQMNRADADIDDLLDLSRRFNRFDMVDGRSLGLGGANSGGGGSGGGAGSASLAGRNGFGGGNGGGSNALTRAMGGGNGMVNGFGGGMGNGLGNGLGGFGSMSGNGLNGQLFNNATAREKAALNTLSSEEIQALENELAQQGQLDAETQADLLQRRDATIYISTIRRNNQIIVRTGDNRSMDQIAQLINQLDVPTPTVLLEVKVLRIVLADGFNSAFEYFGAAGNTSTAMSDGSLQPTFPGASAAARTLGAGLGVAGGVPGSLSFQMVDDKFRVRMQLLESKNCVTALATPLILTANNEVSRIFVGDTLPFTVGFTPSQVLSSVTAVNGAVAATPVTELRDVGQSLLITPNINADRTVTLRVIEENSERVVAGSSIPVPATSGSGVTNINVDTVRRRTISGTIVAQDGMAVALGGLIEEQAHDSRDQVPVLGNIPGLGLLFRRQATGKSRSELVVIVRPYVFNTPTESAATTEMLLGELSTHPNSGDVTATNNALPCPVTRSESESSQRAKLFQLHNRALSPY